MASASMRDQAYQLATEGSRLFGTGTIKSIPAVALAILDLADAVRELARKK